MSVKNQQEKVKDVLAMCEIHWLMNRIPEDKVVEMSSELAQHLRQAMLDGKPVGAVVGPDEFAFAESWAEEARPSMSLGDGFVEVAYLLSVLVTTGTAFYHMIEGRCLSPFIGSRSCFSWSAPRTSAVPTLNRRHEENLGGRGGWSAVPQHWQPWEQLGACLCSPSGVGVRCSSNGLGTRPFWQRRRPTSSPGSGNRPNPKRSEYEV